MHHCFAVQSKDIFLFPKGHMIYQGHLKPLSEDQITDLRKKINEILKEPKYMKMSELAEL